MGPENDDTFAALRATWTRTGHRHTRQTIAALLTAWEEIPPAWRLAAAETLGTTGHKPWRAGRPGPGAR